MHRMPPGLPGHHRVLRRLGRLFGWLWESAPPRLIGQEQHLYFYEQQV
jgi:hypothetical protein